MAFAIAVACSKERAETTAAKTYDAAGVVVSIDPQNQNIIIDHEDIPGLMPAMEMRFAVEDSTLLRGIDPEDRLSLL